MKEDLLKIINHYGVLPQLKYLQSEVFEFNEAVMIMQMKKWEMEGKSPEEVEPILNDLRLHVEEEFADVMVMLEQFKAYYNLNNNSIIEIMKFKIERQLERIKNEENIDE